MITIIPSEGESLTSIAQRCDALYICPKDANGARLGSLVVYAGIGSDGVNKVGDIYFNFAMIEPHLLAVEAYAAEVCAKITADGLQNSFDVICGIPEGGRTLGQVIARLLGKTFVYPTKVPTETPPGQKQRYSWSFGRFRIPKGVGVAVVDDVHNNFTTTDMILELINDAGGNAVALLSALNRSVGVRDMYSPRNSGLGERIPVIAAINQPYPEFDQSDGEVKDDIAAGKLELRVKDNWPHLKEMMARYSATA